MSEFVVVWSLRRGPIANEPLDAEGQRLAEKQARLQACREDREREERVRWESDRVIWKPGFDKLGKRLPTCWEGGGRAKRLMQLATKARYA